MKTSGRAWAAALLVGAGLALAAACHGEPPVTCREGDIKACVCFSDENGEPNDFRCEPPGDSLCCAAEAWPEDGTFCQCSRPWRCALLYDSVCTCQLGALVVDPETYPEVEHCVSPEDAVCCQFWDTCSCGNSMCGEGETQVADCNFATVRDLLAAYTCEAKLGAVEIDSCAVPE